MENTQDAQKQRDSLEWLDDGEGARLAPDDKMIIKAIKHDNRRFGHIDIYWIWHGYAILRSKRVDSHGCDTLGMRKLTQDQQEYN
ncbi:hypothetical protein O181_119426 [Austropuccinia psidii MF-1]|uniref:Uncharacterized protein n=1 Tax=Austropuccinia psidii MF-1 TaxID=1389203 RepID=A0A9Q3PZM9_9BASI|nr:hypothetical protein [Austropuccinia psidii MF-1]